MRQQPHSNIQRVQAWVDRRQPGDKFRAASIAKELNLTSEGVSCVLKWQDNVEKDSMHNGANIWVRV